MVTRAVYFSFHSPWSQRLALPIPVARIDVEVKLNQTVLRRHADQYTLKAIETTICTWAHCKSVRHFGFRLVYSNSFREGVQCQRLQFNFGNGDSKAMTMYSGPDLRISTGEPKKAAIFEP